MAKQIIVTHSEGGIEIEHDGKLSGPLTFGECLELMTAILLDARDMRAMGWLRTPEQWAEWNARINKKGGAT